MSSITLIIIDVGAWFALHCIVSALTFLMPLSWFHPGATLFRPHPWERGGRVYARLFGIRGWKNLLPDGAALFKGAFRKRRMASSSPAYCRRFAVETCRAELSHLLQMAAAGLFFLWNPWYAALAMVPYAIAVNVPCVLAQRFNRPRLLALAEHQEYHHDPG